MNCLACGRHTGALYAGGYCSEECWYNDGCASELTISKLILKKAQQVPDGIEETQENEEKN